MAPQIKNMKYKFIFKKQLLFYKKEINKNDN